MFYDHKPTIICLTGPTASGKTKAALYLAENLPCEIISVDSAMVYRFLDIGTAKPSRDELNQVKHHLIDIKDPSEIYSAAQFRSDALKVIDDILARKKIPLLVGGTMLYFRALQEGLSDLPQANPSIRQKILEEAEKKGWFEMHQRLAVVDPQAAERIKPSDPQRIQRALEVYEVTGKTMTQLWSEHQDEPLPYNVINFNLLPNDRALLKERIAQRFDQMLQNGLIEEVHALHQREDLHINLPSIRSVGYRQVWEYLDGDLSYQEMKEKSIIATRQLAKRQLTWLRRWDKLLCFDSEQTGVEKKILHYLATLSIKF